MKASELARVLSAPAPDPGGDELPAGYIPPDERPSRQKRPAFDDWPGRYAECYEAANEIFEELQKDLARGQITVDEFNELWDDTNSDLQACKDSVDYDYDHPETWLGVA